MPYTSQGRGKHSYNGFPWKLVERVKLHNIFVPVLMRRISFFLFCFKFPLSLQVTLLFSTWRTKNFDSTFTKIFLYEITLRKRVSSAQSSNKNFTSDVLFSLSFINLPHCFGFFYLPVSIEMVKNVTLKVT